MAPSSKEGVVIKVEDGLSVQERRRQLLEKKRLEKREQQKAMGLSTPDTTATKVCLLACMHVVRVFSVCVWSL